MVLEPTGQHILGAGQKDIFPVQLEEVRALPHQAEPVFVFGQHTLELPVEPVRAGVKEDLAAAVGRAVPRHAAVGPIRLPPDFRVPEIHLAAALGDVLAGQDRIAGVLLIVHAVSHRDALGLPVVTGPVRQLGPGGDTRIHQQLPAVSQLHRAAGKAPVLVCRRIRGQGGREILPVEQVLTDRVPPVHGAPFGFVGVILIKQVVFPPVIGKAVGIVHPSHPGRQVERGAGLGRDQLLRDLLMSPRFP